MSLSPRALSWRRFAVLLALAGCAFGTAGPVSAAGSCTDPASCAVEQVIDTVNDAVFGPDWCLFTKDGKPVYVGDSTWGDQAGHQPPAAWNCQYCLPYAYGQAVPSPGDSGDGPPLVPDGEDILLFGQAVHFTAVWDKAPESARRWTCDPAALDVFRP